MECMYETLRSVLENPGEQSRSYCSSQTYLSSTVLQSIAILESAARLSKKFGLEIQPTRLLCFARDQSE